jgi:hypothetical protein
MANPVPDFLAILQTLTKHHVDFIVVGGVCAVLHGAPVTTFDLDVVHARVPDNLQRLLSALQDLEALYREHMPRQLRPTLSHLASPGHQLLMTRAGPLDLLGTIGDDRGYDDLLRHTIELDIGGGLRLRLLDLATLIEVKEGTARERDQAVLPILRRVLEEKKKGSPSD